MWIPASEDQRWYILPDGADWNAVLAWLISHALPTHVPEALRRVRHATFIDLELQTPEEARARRGLSDLEAEYAERKAMLEQELRTAEARAEPVRNGLLYDTGDELAAAVSQVLTDAGLAVLDVDDELGGPISHTLVGIEERPPVSHDRLMEIKDTAEVIRLFNAAFVNHDPDLLTGIISEDCVMESIQPAPNGTRYEGREACLEFWQTLAADKNVQFAPEDVDVFEDRAVVRWRVTFGDGSVDGVFDGVEANSVRGVNLTRVRNGQIVESLGYSKTP